MTGPPATTPVRADLLALTAEALAALSNRGLVKRATREVEAGTAPSVSIDANGTVLGAHPDGAASTLPPGAGLGSCTCGAAAVCRHLLATVLAYQATAAAPVAPAASIPVWSPGEFTDEALAALVGARALSAARRAYRAGYVARVRRPIPSRPEPSVELSSCTVRFLVPHELGYARADAADGSRPEAIPLAVWAFRAADSADPVGTDVDMEVGGPSTVDRKGPPSGSGGGRAGTSPGGAAEGSTGVESAVALAAEVLRAGVVHIGASFASRVAAVCRELDGRGLRWPLLAVEDLGEQLSAYRDRGADYRGEHVAEVLAEIMARHRAAANGGPRTRILGTEEPAETPMRRVRLTGLGARVTGDQPGTADGDAPAVRTVEVFLAHPDNDMVLVLRRRWETDATGPTLAGRRVGGVAVGGLATGHVVTESAHRGASRTVRLAAGRVARTTVTPSGGAWDSLPETLLVRDFAATCEQMANLPPRVIRPRVEAEFVRAVAVDQVVRIGYHPGAQRLDAVVADAAGTTALVTLRHEGAAPGALDALAAALANRPRLVSGTLHRSGGGLVIEPIAVVVGDSVRVPAFAAGDGSASLELADPDDDEPLAAALEAGAALLAEVPHRGLGQLPLAFPDRLRAAAGALTRVGLRRCGDALQELALAILRERTAGPRTEPGVDGAVPAWVDAQIRLLVTRDLR